MPRAKYAVERGAPKHLEIAWTKGFEEVTVSWEEVVIEELTRGDLDAAADVRLPEGTEIRITLKAASALGNAKRLAIHSDGKPLPGTLDDPVEAAKQGGYILYAIAGLTALCGVVAMVTESEALASAGAGIFSLFAAGLFGVLGFFTMRGSRVALGLAIALYAFDWIAGVALALAADVNPGLGGIIIRVILIAALGKSFMSMGGPSMDR